MRDQQSAVKQGSPIQVVSRRTGLSADVIRVWERRYNVVCPSRTETGRRLYGEEDVEKLLLLQSVLAGGRRIGDVAGLSTKQLQDLIRQDQKRPDIAVLKNSEDDRWKECLEAVRGLDAEGLQGLLKRESARRGAESFLEDVVAPLMREVGELWVKGHLDPYHEHFNTAAIRKTLQEMMSAASANSKAPGLVVATPSGQFHEVGALMAGAQAAINGWRVLYLGVDLPAADIAAAAIRSKARAVALSIVFPADDPALGPELERLGNLLPREAILVVGGGASSSYAAFLKGANAVMVQDTRSLRGILETALVGRKSGNPGIDISE